MGEEHYAVLNAIDLHTLRWLILGPHIDISLRKAGELYNEGDVQVQQVEWSQRQNQGMYLVWVYRCLEK